MGFAFRIALQPFTDVSRFVSLATAPKPSSDVSRFVSLAIAPIVPDQLLFAQLYFVYQQGCIVDIIYDFIHFERNIQSTRFEYDTIYVCLGQNVCHKEFSNTQSRNVPHYMLCLMDKCEKMLIDMGNHIKYIKNIFILDDNNLEKSKILFVGGNVISFTNTLFNLAHTNTTELIEIGNQNNQLTHALFKNKKFNEIDKIVFNISTLIENYYIIDKSIQHNWLAVWISKVYDNLMVVFPMHKEYIFDIKTSMVMECLTK